MTSLARQNFAAECEAAINKQVNMELEASYAYFAFAVYFDQDNVALPGAAKFFREQSHEEREHAEKLADYQNKRGGRVVYQDVKKPTKASFEHLQEAMEHAVKMEKAVNQSLLNLHQLAGQQNDAALQDYLESEFLQHQVESIKQLASYATQAQHNGPGLGEYLLDRLSLKDESK